MNRFFIPPQCIQQNTIQFPPEISAQIRNVLRLKMDDQVQIFDNSGNGWLVKLENVNPKEVSGAIIAELHPETEPVCEVVLCLPLTRREKFEWMLQKCTEAGVTAFQPFISERTLVQDAANDPKKQSRWCSIIREAAEQSGRARLPELRNPLPLQRLMAVEARSALKLFFWEEENDVSLNSLFLSQHCLPESILLMVGPEGGFSTAEADFAKTNGWQVLTLGKRIFRLETAALAAVLLTNYELDRLSVSN